jgi:hypothetical protein
MIFGSNDGYPAIDGVPIKDYIEKYNHLIEKSSILNIGWELINNLYPPDRITKICSKFGDDLDKI